MVYILIETEYDVVCRSVIYDTLEEAKNGLHQWAEAVDNAMPNTSVWISDDETYAHVITVPYSIGPWAQILKKETLKRC